MVPSIALGGLSRSWTVPILPVTSPDPPVARPRQRVASLQPHDGCPHPSRRTYPSIAWPAFSYGSADPSAPMDGPADVTDEPIHRVTGVLRRVACAHPSRWTCSPTRDQGSPARSTSPSFAIDACIRRVGSPCRRVAERCRRMARAPPRAGRPRRRVEGCHGSRRNSSCYLPDVGASDRTDDDERAIGPGNVPVEARSAPSLADPPASVRPASSPDPVAALPTRVPDVGQRRRPPCRERPSNPSANESA